jgi:hypothetical protein
MKDTMIFCGTALLAAVIIHAVGAVGIFLASKLGAPPIIVPLGMIGAALGAAWDA